MAKSISENAPSDVIVVSLQNGVGQRWNSSPTSAAGSDCYLRNGSVQCRSVRAGVSPLNVRRTTQGTILIDDTLDGLAEFLSVLGALASSVSGYARRPLGQTADKSQQCSQCSFKPAAREHSLAIEIGGCSSGSDERRSESYEGARYHAGKGARGTARRASLDSATAEFSVSHRRAQNARDRPAAPARPCGKIFHADAPPKSTTCRG